MTEGLRWASWVNWTPTFHVHFFFYVESDKRPPPPPRGTCLLFTPAKIRCFGSDDKPAGVRSPQDCNAPRSWAEAWPRRCVVAPIVVLASLRSYEARGREEAADFRLVLDPSLGTWKLEEASRPVLGSSCAPAGARRPSHVMGRRAVEARDETCHRGCLRGTWDWGCLSQTAVHHHDWAYNFLGCLFCVFRQMSQFLTSGAHTK